MRVVSIVLTILSVAESQLVVVNDPSYSPCQGYCTVQAVVGPAVALFVLVSVCCLVFCLSRCNQDNVQEKPPQPPSDLPAKDQRHPAAQAQAAASGQQGTEEDRGIVIETRVHPIISAPYNERHSTDQPPNQNGRSLIDFFQVVAPADKPTPQAQGYMAAGTRHRIRRRVRWMASMPTALAPTST